MSDDYEEFLPEKFDSGRDSLCDLIDFLLEKFEYGYYQCLEDYFGGKEELMDEYKEWQKEETVL
jgi:predicted CopG family antitoxin